MANVKALGNIPDNFFNMAWTLRNYEDSKAVVATKGKKVMIYGCEVFPVASVKVFPAFIYYDCGIYEPATYVIIVPFCGHFTAFPVPDREV